MWDVPLIEQLAMHVTYMRGCSFITTVADELFDRVKTLKMGLTTKQVPRIFSRIFQPRISYYEDKQTEEFANLSLSC